MGCGRLELTDRYFLKNGPILGETKIVEQLGWALELQVRLFCLRVSVAIQMEIRRACP
jgi:hypothetical protein